MSNKKNQYEIFLKVVETENISRAAEALHYTQSGVSHAISSLERELGFPLFSRSQNGVIPTYNALALLETVRELVSVQQKLETEIFNLNHIVSGKIRIGSIPSTTTQWLPDILLKFQQLHPDMTFEIQEGTYDEIEKWIVQGVIDCGFLSQSTSKEVVLFEVYKDPLLVIVPSEHVLNQKEELSFQDLRQVPLIIPESGDDRDIQHILQECELPLHIEYTLKDDRSMLALVEAGMGVAIMPELVFGGYETITVPHRLEPPQFRKIGIASLSSNRVSVTTKLFVEYVKQYIQVHYTKKD